MRPKFVIALTLLTVAIIGGIYFFRPGPSHPAPQNEGTPATPTAAVDSAPKTAPVESAPDVKTTVAKVLAAPEPVSTDGTSAPTNTVVATPSTTALTAEEREAVIAQLQDWQANDDKQSLNNIVAQLASPDQKVRTAAIEATKQFGSADAIPSLKEAAARTGNEADKAALLEAITFLGLPSLGSKEAAPNSEKGTDAAPSPETPKDPAP
jgi:cytoskeletal protein RodZ